MRESLELYSIRNLMLEALGNVDVASTIYLSYNFTNTNGGTVYDLIRITEGLAIKFDQIEELMEIPQAAWACTGENLIEGHSTNFTKLEIERCWEAFYLLLNSNIVAPGMYRNSSQLPYFHITTYGKECIDARDILPYDVDGFLQRIKSIENIDEWVLFLFTMSP